MARYAELHAHSHFSLLDGASPPEALVQRAAALDMPALALTDHDAVYGAVRFSAAARAQGVRPILGAELTLEGGEHLTLLAENEAGWHNLCWLISRARHNAPKGEAALPMVDLEGHTAGLIALSGCPKGALSKALERRDWDGALEAAHRYQQLFGPDRYWIELQHHLLPPDNLRVERLIALAEHLGLGYVATNNAHYATRDGRRLQDVLVCIRHNTPLERAEGLRRPGSECYLKPDRQLAPLFAPYPDALANTLKVAERCTFELGSGLQELPRFPRPASLDATGYLRQLCETALPARYGDVPTEVAERLTYELSVIERAGLANYFLVVWDIVRFARENGVRCQGRGSAANSLVAYLLNITPVDPLAHDLVFERFLSDERALTPDIDIDFDAARREEVIQYVVGRYGAEHTAMACTFVTFRTRSALRDVGKALGLPSHLIDRAAKSVDRRDFEDVGEIEELANLSPGSPLAQLVELTEQIRGFPRHLGIHNGGMVITGPPLAERVPTEPATMPGRVVVQWDKEALEDAGLVKIDLLGLRMLSVLSEAVETIEATTGERVDLDALAFDDPAVYELIGQVDTVGVFQVESRAQAQVLPRLRPSCFADLVVSISLIRPGPIQGDMVHPYLRRRLGEEPVAYPHRLLEPALKETLGVILFQEQVLKVAHDLAGFTRGQGELLRRALGSKQGYAMIDSLHEAFIAGAQEKGVPQSTAKEVFAALRAFGGYSFPKSHAATFAVLVYQSAWLKRYHPAPFYVAILNNQPMGFWSPSVIVSDAKRHGIEVRPVDANHSQPGCAVEGEAVRMGVTYVKGLGEAGSARLVEARGERPFHDLADLCRRTRLPRRLIENLILAGGLDGWGIPRRKLVWELGTLRYQAEELDLVFGSDEVSLPPLGEAGRMGLELSLTGVSTGEHPMAFYRDWLTENGVLGSLYLADCDSGRRVRIAGWVIMHQAPPTANGFRFLTLEDEDGMMNIIVRPSVYARWRRVVRGAATLVVEGIVQREGAVVNLLAERFAGFA